ncbi:hypothetical protein ACJIZ3_012935 [Penstemon smallii]|uniref:RRM domain-containing protein n=1 Tax=Penstemon smallii TaxID=265156 RepID=A0ABD3URM2_9LAMI
MAKPARGHPLSPSGSVSGSSSSSHSHSSGSGSHSRARSCSRSFSSSPRSGSSRSRSPAPPRRSPTEGVGRGRSQPPPPSQAKKTSPPPRKASPIPESLVLHVDQLSRNVNENHLKEIFGNFGEVVNIRLAIDRIVNIPKGFSYVEFKIRADAEKAQLYMDGAQVDGKVVRAKFTLPERKKPTFPPKAVATTSRRDAPKTDDDVLDADRDKKRPREENLLDTISVLSPRRKPLSPPRSHVARRGSPKKEPDSPPPPRRRADSPICRRADSTYRQGDSPPPRRRPASPLRDRSPSSPPRRFRSPLRRIRGSPVRRRSLLPFRRRSPRRVRRPPIVRRRSRFPIRRSARSPSSSPSPRRDHRTTPSDLRMALGSVGPKQIYHIFFLFSLDVGTSPSIYIAKLEQALQSISTSQ